MSQIFNFVYDNFYNDKPHPNFVPLQDLSQGYDHLWNTEPNVVPLRLNYYFEKFNYKVNHFKIDDAWPKKSSLYPVAIGWFNFDVDYIGYLTTKVKQEIIDNNLKILFYYHEGDDPIKQKLFLDQQCLKHGLPTNCYIFVSGHTLANSLDNFVWFPDHELFYWKANQTHEPVKCHTFERPYNFTVLSRVHKWWRATVMTDMHRLGLLDQALWSYNTIDVGDSYSDNPIEIEFLSLQEKVTEFLQGAPYKCDDFDSVSHNRHNIQINSHYYDSYINVVLETFFCVDGNNGAFLTEKTFKPIKHGQMFVLVAPPGSLQVLKDLGYKIFDNLIDSSYDKIQNHTERWCRLRSILAHLNTCDLQKLYTAALPDIIHNQELFCASKADRLDYLRNKIYAKN
jgi:hypothetical protein